MGLAGHSFKGEEMMINCFESVVWQSIQNPTAHLHCTDGALWQGKAETLELMAEKADVE